MTSGYQSMLRVLVCLLLLTTLLLQSNVLAGPNLVLIVADDLDQNLGTIESMPNLQQLPPQGLTFSDFFVTNALCAPPPAPRPLPRPPSPRSIPPPTRGRLERGARGWLRDVCSDGPRGVDARHL